MLRTINGKHLVVVDGRINMVFLEMSKVILGGDQVLPESVASGNVALFYSDTKIGAI